MALTVGVLKAIGGKLDAVAVLDDGLATDEDVEPGIEGVVDAQLVAVELESAPAALIHEHRRLSNRTSDRAVRQVLQEKNLGLL